jgi:hypothetical protein
MAGIAVIGGFAFLGAEPLAFLPVGLQQRPIADRTIELRIAKAASIVAEGVAPVRDRVRQFSTAGGIAAVVAKM